MVCNARCGKGWICEAHPDHEWPHTDCDAPGVPCRALNCPWWRGPQAPALDTADDAIEVMPDGRWLRRHSRTHANAVRDRSAGMA
jgi:hypothetical protein